MSVAMWRPSESASARMQILWYLRLTKSSADGSTPRAWEILLISCEDKRLDSSTSQLFKILPLSGRIAWYFRSLACFAEPPAESPSTINNSHRSGSSLVQSANLPGKVGPPVAFFLLTLTFFFARFWAFSIALATIWSPASGCWFNQRVNASLITFETKVETALELNFSLVCPENWGSSSLIDKI